MANPLRVLGRGVRSVTLILSGYWRLLAQFESLQARLDTFEGRVARALRNDNGAEQARLREREDRLDAQITALGSDAQVRHDVSTLMLDRMQANVSGRLETLIAQQTRLTERGGLLTEIVAAEIDRLDGYLVHHSAMLLHGIVERQTDLFRHDEAVARLDGIRRELVELTTQVASRSAAIEAQVAGGRQTTVAKPSQAYLSDGLDVLVMAGSYDLIVPSQEAGLLAYLLRHGLDLVEPGVRVAIQDRLKPGSVAIDIGANVGVHSLTMAAAVGPAGSVICFEPLPHLAATLERTLRVNNFGDRARVEQLALADRQGEAILHRARHAPLSSLYPLPASAGVTELTVITSTLDACLPGGARVDFIKMDVEGAEPRVWRGMRRVIRDNPELEIVLEWSASHFQRSGESTRAFVSAIREAGFIIYRIADVEPFGGITEIRGDDVELEAANLLLTRRRIEAS